MRVVLISTYDMGRQPLGLAAPAAWLRARGCEVVCADLSRGPLRAEDLTGAEVVAVFLPMHTATRLALQLLPQLRAAAPGARFCAYGLYAGLHREQLTGAGPSAAEPRVPLVRRSPERGTPAAPRPGSRMPALTGAGKFDAVFGGEYEAALTEYVMTGRAQDGATLPRLPGVVPDRSGLPALVDYARLHVNGEARVTGYAEASRGCKHVCRHCPIVPVYGGRFRITPVETVLADIRQQVAAGAQHITFGDPDFLNGPTHAMRVIEALHREFPELSYDVTIKVEHLRRQAELLPRLRDSGCVLVTTAAESFDDDVLRKLEKGHTRADLEAVLDHTRRLGLALNPTFVAFTPWTTVRGFAEMLGAVAGLDLVDQVQPVQYGIRLLLPPGSLLLALPDAAAWLGEYDPEALSYRWRAPDSAAAELCTAVQAEVAGSAKAGRSRRETFAAIATLAGVRVPPAAPQRATIPWLDEPWFC